MPAYRTVRVVQFTALSEVGREMLESRLTVDGDHIRIDQEQEALCIRFSCAGIPPLYDGRYVTTTYVRTYTGSPSSGLAFVVVVGVSAPALLYYSTNSNSLY